MKSKPGPRRQGVQYIGRTFTRLAVLKVVYVDDTRWFTCRCLCGNKKQIRADAVIAGRTKSCGCLNQESRSKPKRFSPNRAVNIKTSRRATSLSNRPAVGSFVNGLLILENHLFTDRGLPKAACRIKYPECSHSGVVPLWDIRNEPPRTCSSCRQLAASNRLRAKQLSSGKRLMAMSKSATLLEWCIFACTTTGRRIRTRWGSTLRRPLVDGFSKYHYDLLLPPDIRTKPIWPWDEQGNTLTKRQLKAMQKKSNA